MKAGTKKREYANMFMLYLAIGIVYYLIFPLIVKKFDYLIILFLVGLLMPRAGP